MHTQTAYTLPRSAAPRPTAWRVRLPMALAAVGSLLTLAVLFLPWYQVGHAPRGLVEQNPLLIAPILAVVLTGGALTTALARGRTPNARTLRAIFALTFVTTLAVVFSLFIHRPGGNAATLLAFGGYPALLGINLVKASAVATLAMTRRRES